MLSALKKKKRGRGEGTNRIQEILSEHKETFFLCVGGCLNAGMCYPESLQMLRTQLWCSVT